MSWARRLRTRGGILWRPELGLRFGFALFLTQGLGRVDAGDFQDWQCGRKSCDNSKREDYGEDRRRVVDSDAVEDAAHGAQGESAEDEAES